MTAIPNLLISGQFGLKKIEQEGGKTRKLKNEHKLIFRLVLFIGFYVFLFFPFFFSTNLKNIHRFLYFPPSHFFSSNQIDSMCLILFATTLALSSSTTN
jgi:hypothetical protein